MSQDPVQIIIMLTSFTGSSLAKQSSIKAGKVGIPTWPDSVFIDMAAGEQGQQAAATLLSMPGIPQNPQDPLMGYGPILQIPTLLYTPGFVYQTIVNALTNYFLPQTVGYTPWNATISSITQSTDGMVIGFGDDWRQDILASAQLLQSLLTQINTAFASVTQGYQVFLVGHGRGGLVARYYLEYVGQTSGDSFLSNIAALITLGTPHLGIPLAFWEIITNSLVSELGVTVPKAVVNNPSFPSTYELLPPSTQPQNGQPGQTPGCFVVGAGSTTWYNVYQDPLKSLLSVQSSVSAATTMFGRLFPNGSKPENTKYYAIFGVSDEDGVGTYDPGTISTFTYTPANQSGEQNQAIFSANTTLYTLGTSLTPPSSPNDVTTNIGLWSGGDGIVPVWSAAFVGGPIEAYYPIANCSHSELTQNQIALATIAEIIGSYQAD